MKDYRVTVKVRNNRILRAIEEAGGSPGAKWCNQHGLDYKALNNLINMTSGPAAKDAQLTRTARQLCDVLDKLPEDLWSSAQLYPLEKNFSEIEMDHAQVMALLPDGSTSTSYLPDLSDFEERQQKALVDKVLETIPARLQTIIRMRFEDDLTLDQIGQALGITKERVRQMEVKALRMLRHPSRCEMLQDCRVEDATGMTDLDRNKWKRDAAERLKSKDAPSS